ncbi:glycosyltransferase [Saccharibacter sp. 17.LH.SD]|uniref:glycosyltransferase family 4 protein n=1 Tax=Saccharibacter sp. 17.LH.SD TaxID=2689393 RepID=UPI0013689273|nr:glycosyltransferase family 4 protein [Saccharibacter sp. 17.LH.SD]MXV43616.1 glycosyltransferase [Saccharibacter sp. 17.LH.SD]
MKILEVTNVDFALRHFVLPVMRALRDAGHDVQGVCADGPELHYVREEGFVVHTVPMERSLSPIAQLRAAVALWRLFRQEKPDMVHAHMPISGVLARLVAWGCGTSCIVYTGHGFLFHQPGPLWRRALGWVMEWCAGQVTDIYLTVSQEEAVAARRLGLHAHPIAIGNGRDLSLFKPNPEARQQVRQAFGLDNHKPVILIVSRLVRHKGYPELLHAMTALPEAELWIVGSRLDSDHGEDLTPLFQQARRDLGDRLRLLGTRDDVALLMAAADVFILPSHFEGLPMVIIEAMLCGLPVVATNIRGVREQVVEGETGLLVTPGLSAPLARALRWCVDHPDDAQKMGRAGRERACQLYSEESVMARLVKILTR